MQHDLADQHFKIYEKIKEWLELLRKSKQSIHFFIVEFTYCQKNEKNYAIKIF